MQLISRRFTTEQRGKETDEKRERGNKEVPEQYLQGLTAKEYTSFNTFCLLPFCSLKSSPQAHGTKMLGICGMVNASWDHCYSLQQHQNSTKTVLAWRQCMCSEAHACSFRPGPMCHWCSKDPDSPPSSSNTDLLPVLSCYNQMDQIKHSPRWETELSHWPKPSGTNDGQSLFDANYHNEFFFYEALSPPSCHSP